MSTPALTTALCGARVFDGEHIREQHSVVYQDGQIVDVVPDHQLPPDIKAVRLEGGLIAPGFIDLQVNGGGGVMFNDDTTQTGLATIAAAHRASGTTAMTPTLISDTAEVHRAGAAAIDAAKAAGIDGILGLHIEGPCFSMRRRGAHKASMIREFSEEDIDWLCSIAPLNLILTLAPEHTRPGQINRLSAAGVNVFAGHTDADYAQITAAVADGLIGFTHLYNAMSAQAAREPGTVGAALDCQRSYLGVIADGHHVHPANLRIAQRSKPLGKVILVSDAMATVGSKTSSFQLYGETIRVNQGRLINAEGVLAGSAIGMIDAVRTMTELVGLALEESLRMASLYPATLLKMQHMFGRIASGYRADLVHLTDDFKVLQTWIAGQAMNHAEI